MYIELMKEVSGGTYKSTTEAQAKKDLIEYWELILEKCGLEKGRCYTLYGQRAFKYLHVQSTDNTFICLRVLLAPDESAAIVWEIDKLSDLLSNIERTDADCCMVSKIDIEYASEYSHKVWEELMSRFKKDESYYIGANDVSDIVQNAILDALGGRKYPTFPSGKEEPTSDGVCNDAKEVTM